MLYIAIKKAHTNSNSVGKFMALEEVLLARAGTAHSGSLSHGAGKK